MDRSEMEQALEFCEFFKLLDKSDIAKIASLCQVNTYESGECVFQQGDYGEHLYIIVQGYIHLERSVDLGSRKGSVVIEALGKGCVGLLVHAVGYSSYPHIFRNLSETDNGHCHQGRGFKTDDGW